MKSFKIVQLLSIAILIYGCGAKKDDSLEGKRKELTELKNQQSTIAAQIKTLEAQVGKSADNTNTQKAIDVVATTIESSNFKHYVQMQGSVESENSTIVTPKSQGIITKVLVNEGDRVRKGQLLAVQDNSILLQSQAEIRSGLEFATTVFEKQKALWDQKIGSEVQYLQAKNQKESLEKRLRTLQTQTALSNITAPTDGTIDEVKLRVGEMPAPPNGYIRLVSLTDLHVVAKVPDAYIGTVRKGDQVEISLPDLKKTIIAKLSFVGSSIDPITRTFRVEAKVKDNQNNLRPNMLAVVKINDQTSKNVVAIQENLIQISEKGALVYVAQTQNNRTIARVRYIKQGLAYKGMVEITEGLQAGDLLITQGYQDLTDSLPILIKK